VLDAGQRRVQHGIPQAEDRRVRADAEREGQDGDRRKCRPDRHRAEGVTKVFDDHAAELLGRSRDGRRGRRLADSLDAGVAASSHMPRHGLNVARFGVT
jgi:hypothetical protein